MRIIWTLVVIVAAVAGGIAGFNRHHHQVQPMPPIYTSTAQVYEDVCGHPDACKQMHDFLQYAETQKRDMGLPPDPANPQPDDTTDGK